MKTPLSTFKKLSIFLFGLLIALLLFLWLALPGIVQSQAEKFVAEKTGHRLSLSQPEFDLFALRLRIAKLRLTEADGKPLLAFDELLADLSLTSLSRRTLVFDAIKLHGMDVTLVELPDGGLNWQPFINALKSKEDKPDEELPRVHIGSFVLAGGSLDFADQRTATGFVARIEPLDLSLHEISTMPGDKGKFKLAARTSLGAEFQLQGDMMLNPLRISGSFNLTELQLTQLAPYLKNSLPAVPQGLLALSANYSIGNDGNKLAVTVEQLVAKLEGIRMPLQAGDAAGSVIAVDRLELAEGRFDLARQELAVGNIRFDGGKVELPGIEAAPQFLTLTLDKLAVNLAERRIRLGQATLAEGRLQAIRDPRGQLDVLAAFAAKPVNQSAAEQVLPPPAPAASVAPATSPWRYQIDKLDFINLAVALRDAGVQPAAELALDNITLNLVGLSDDLQAPLPLRLAFDVRTGGRLTAEGSVIPAKSAADLKFKLSDLALHPAQPYLARQARLLIAGGQLSMQGKLGYSADRGPDYRGDFTLANLRLTEADGKAGGATSILAWKTLDSQALALTAHRLDIEELRLNGLNTQLVIDKNKNLNLKMLLKSAATEGGTAVAATVAPPAATPFRVNIERLRFRDGALYFADQSLVQPFGTRIHKLRGSISNLSSSDADGPGQVELDGEVGDYGLARALGQVDLFNPTVFMDLKAIFRNVEMSRLTPYVATFAGRKVEAGKLSLDLQYKIKQRQLQGDNLIVIERLTLGERVESASADDLPLDLAIAILQDADGRIELGLPVTGNLDDPQFDYGLIVRKTIASAMGKIVTAPFRALAALFGNGEQDEIVSFEVGAAQLTPPEREKLVRLAGVLAKRPGLVLGVGASYSEADRTALQDLQLRRTVLTRTGQQVTERGDPGPLSTRQPKVQAALERLYAERIGSSFLEAQRVGFLRANPGLKAEGAGGQTISRLSGKLAENKTVAGGESGSAISSPVGADFHAMLFAQLRDTEVVSDERLQLLAQTRSKNMFAALEAAGVGAVRLQQLPAEKGESANGEVPVRLVLDAVKGGGQVGSQAN